MKKIFSVFLMLMLGFMVFGFGGTTIHVLYMAQAGYQPSDMIEMGNLFEELTGVKVEYTFVKYDEMHDKIVTSSAVPFGTYDVVLLDLIWTAEFGAKKLVMPLDSYITPKMRKDIPPAILSAFEYKGRIWAMPFLANFQLFFYNKDYIKRAGFDGSPKTLEGLYNQMKVMKEKGIVKYPWADSWNQKEGLVCEYVWLTGAYGGDLLDKDGKPIFNKGAGLKALEFMVKLLKDGLADPASLVMDEPMAKDAFISGNIAFNTNWTFQYGLMNDSKVSNVVGKGVMGLIPVSEEVYKPGYETASVSGFQGLAIPRNSKNQDSAWKFIRFVTAPVVQRAYLKEMPIWKSVQNNTWVRTVDPVMGVKAAEIATCHHRPKVPNYPEFSSILQRYIHLALEMKMTPKEALDKAVEEIENLH
ncbi:MAG: extracellular solute-binding protein [Thermotogae bacterium]|nr:extracellular solute-binding protein [Thermotogota bacterium]